MTERKTDRVVSVSLSVLVHAAILGVLAWGWWQYRQPTPTPQSLAIEGTVVHNAAPPTPAPPAPTPPVQQPQPPQPTPDEQAQQKAQEEQEQRRKADEARLAEQKHIAETAAAQQRQREEAEKAAAEKATAEKAAAEKAAAEKAEADRKAEEQRKAEAARQAKAEADKKAQERAQREADLRAQLAAEEHLNAVQASPAKAEYLSLITARINHAWIRPPTARAGVKCSVHITQVPGGVITNVSVTGCNGDESVRQSVETAAYRASPLPAPSDPALFDPNIDVTFAPDE
jgi:colicin import membrane protein